MYYLYVNCAEFLTSISIFKGRRKYTFFYILFYSKLYTTGLGEVLLKWLSLGTVLVKLQSNYSKWGSGMFAEQFGLKTFIKMLKLALLIQKF